MCCGSRKPFCLSRVLSAGCVHFCAYWWIRTYFVNYSTEEAIQCALDCTPWVPDPKGDKQRQSDVVVVKCEGESGHPSEEDTPHRLTLTSKLRKFRCEADWLDVSLSQSPFNVAAFRKRKSRRRVGLSQGQRLLCPGKGSQFSKYLLVLIKECLFLQENGGVARGPMASGT